MTFAPCVVIPVYNHAATLPAVVEGARAFAPVLVVDDGSTDGARAWLEAASGIDSIILPANRGKGFALRAGLSRALERGFTHAVTIDADGQHDPGQIAEFIAQARERPEALLLGVRDLVAEGAPAARRRANTFSNFWFALQTGLRLPDTQCGFRCYPIAAALGLGARGERYGFELEIMALAAWAGIEIRPVPVRARYGGPEAARSHFRPVVDFLRIGLLNAKLTAWAALRMPGRLARRRRD